MSGETPKKLFVGLGTNMGNRRKNLARARQKLKLDCKRILASSTMETEPVGINSSKKFLNQVVLMENHRFETAVSALKRLLSVEVMMGRDRAKNKPDRIIDLDLLYFGEVIRKGHPTVPHPRLHQRRFVLEPLTEIAPSFIHPIKKKSQQELLKLLLEKS